MADKIMKTLTIGDVTYTVTDASAQSLANEAKSAAETAQANIDALIDGDVANAKTDIANMKTQIANIEDNMYDDTEVRELIQGNTDDVGALEDRASALEGKVDTLVDSDIGKSVRAIASEVTSDIFTWSKIYDSGEITAEVNSFANINIADYKSLRIIVKCVQTANTLDSTAGAVIFTGENDMEYSFSDLFGNLITNNAGTISGAMANFSIVDGFVICENASRGVNAEGILSTTEGQGSWSLSNVSGGLIMCNSPLTKMAISTANQSASHFYGVGSRVIVWGCKI